MPYLFSGRCGPRCIFQSGTGGHPTRNFCAHVSRFFLILGLLAWAVIPLRSATTLAIDASQIKAPVSPTLYGLMTEEINHSYDGGLYAELVQNRSFLDDPLEPVHWSLIGDKAQGQMSLDPSQPLSEAIKTSLKLDAGNASAGGRIGIANEGFWGIPVLPATTYRASFHAKSDHFTGPLTVSIESRDGSKTFASAQVSGLKPDWGSYTVSLTTSPDISASADNRLVISTESPGTIWFGLVSLFPPTFADRPNGNRIDLMKFLIELKPSFLRLPGGNYLEGGVPADHFPWKTTLGDLIDRPGHPGCWGYRSSDGMGLLEFLEWTEDMHAEPVLAVYAGYSLSGISVIPGSNLKPYVDEALDEIEYVVGDTDTRWGGERAKDGHPAPFPLHWVEIGNEDFFDKSLSYDERFTQFFDAIRAKYPQLKIISTVAPGQQGPVHSRTPDAVDRHDYTPAKDYEKMAPTVFDQMDRKGPKIFEGEWAAYEGESRTSGGRNESPTSSFAAALGDAAWMAAMERNSDLVVMQCYAPLLVRIDPGARRWRPDLVAFDALHVYGGPSYYAYRLFSQHHGDQIVTAHLNNVLGNDIPPLHYSVTRNRTDGTIFIKMVNVSAQPQIVDITLQNAGTPQSEANVYSLLAPNGEQNNSIEDPSHIVPITSVLKGWAGAFTYTFAPLSVNVIELPFLPSPDRNPAAR